MGSEKNYSSEQKREEKISSIVFSLSFVVFIIIVILYINNITQKTIELRTDIKQYQELELMETKIIANSSRLEAHVVLLSNTLSLRRLLEYRETEERESVNYLFSKVIEYNTRVLLPTFQQIRLIDLLGNEVVRVELDKNKSAKIIPLESLQNKSHRPYFKESLELPQNKIFGSALDLNIEHGVIEQPNNPVIRVSRPVTGKTGAILGFLILNQQYSTVFDEINAMNLHPGDEWFLLNSDGYYLKADHESKEYGFMFDDKKDVGFFSEYPEFWADITNNKEYKFKHRDGVFYIRRFNPYNDSIFEKSENYTWYLVMKVNLDRYKGEFELLRRGLLIGCLILFPFLGIVGWVLGRSLVKNRWYLKFLKESATHDGMTGLLNHNAVLEQLDYLIKLYQRNKKPINVAYIDLNNLKTINDTKGYEAGDLLITTLSTSIKVVIRDSDIASRVGGDEFLILFPELGEEDAKAVMLRIHKEFETEGLNLLDQKTSFSWGISSWNHNGDSREDLLDRADKSMYEMKKIQHMEH